MGTAQSVGSQITRLLPGADAGTLRRLEDAARKQAFARRDVLHARGHRIPPFVMLNGHVMYRRVVETGQVRGALITGSGLFRWTSIHQRPGRGRALRAGRPDRRVLGDLGSATGPNARARGRRVGSWLPRHVSGLRDGSQCPSRSTVLRYRPPTYGGDPYPLRRRDLRHASSGRPASRLGGNDRNQPGDDVPNIARPRG